MTSAKNVTVPKISTSLAPKSPLDIPKTRDNRPSMLPTPPNSISPDLFPRNNVPPIHVESSIDLQDTAIENRPIVLSSAALSDLETAGAISPSLLAKHHLPQILLGHGPVAIRHVLSELTQTVPGFSRIPTSKARRLVVCALESRNGGGVNGEVEFDKVGWGRWDARIRRQSVCENRSSGRLPVPGPSASAQDSLSLSPPASVPDSYALSSAEGLMRQLGNRKRRDMFSFGSWAADSAISSRDEIEDMNMAEHEADKMSLDGHEDISISSSEAPDSLPCDNVDDDTDEEDWASIGADALRLGSFANSSVRGAKHLPYHYNNKLSRPTGLTKPVNCSITFNKNIPGRLAPSLHTNLSYIQQHHAPMNHSHMGQNSSSSSASSSKHVSNSGSENPGNHELDGSAVMCQELEAVEALMRMGSM